MKIQKSTAAIILLLFNIGNAPASGASDEYLQFVDEVILEDGSYYIHNGESNVIDQQLQQHMEETDEDASRAKAIDTERKRIQTEREEAFVSELAQLKEGKEAAKKLLRQKKRDANIVNRIHKASKANNHYSVLGIRDFIFSNVRIPSRTITIIPNHLKITVPELVLFRISDKKIKRAYREMAKLVHPDKSKDPRAVEAFLLVEDAATILLNDVTRTEYDLIVRKQRAEGQSRIRNQIRQGMEKSFMIANTVVQTGKKFFGPLTIPVIIIVVLIA